MENVQEMKSTISFWAIVDFLVNTKEKVLHMPVFTRTESTYANSIQNSILKIDELDNKLYSLEIVLI